MGGALVILVLVASGQRADPSTRSVGPALEQAARRPVIVSVREVAAVPDEAQVARAAADGRADVVVELGWRSPTHDQAIVHLHARGGEMLRSSELDFAESEPRGERGRAVGFAIATMLADEPVEARILASIGTTSTAASVTASSMAEPLDSDRGGRVEAVPSAAAAPTATTAAFVPPSPDRGRIESEKPPHFAIEGAGSALADASGAAVGAGPVIRLQWNVAREVGLRVGGGARWFSVAGRRASEIGASAGVLWTFVHSGVLAAAARAEVGLLDDSFTEQVLRTNPRGAVLPAETLARTGIAPSFLAGLEGDWRPGRTMTLFLAVDVDASTRVLATRSAGISPLWVGLEGGARVSF